MSETFFKATKRSLYFLTKCFFFVKINNEHGNVHFFFSDNVRRTFYKLAVTMQDIVILLHD